MIIVLGRSNSSLFLRSEPSQSSTSFDNNTTLCSGSTLAVWFPRVSFEAAQYFHSPEVNGNVPWAEQIGPVGMRSKIWISNNLLSEPMCIEKCKHTNTVNTEHSFCRVSLWTVSTMSPKRGQSAWLIVKIQGPNPTCLSMFHDLTGWRFIPNG